MCHKLARQIAEHCALTHRAAIINNTITSMRRDIRFIIDGRDPSFRD